MNAVPPDLRAKTNPHLFLLAGEAPGAPGLRATHCHTCGYYTLGRAAICSHCFSRKVEPCAAGQRAEIVEFAIANHPAGGFEAPYAIGMIRTDEGMMLFSPLSGDAESFAPGMKIRFVTLERDGGQVGFAYAADKGAGQ